MSTPRSPTVISPTLIGREAQLGTLTDLLAQASGAQGHIALIAGEAGIGKSRLVAEVAAMATRGGIRSVQGRCFEHDRVLPYAPLIDLLHAFCVGRSADELAATFGSAAAELVKISPDLASTFPQLTPTAVLDPEQEKHRLFEAITLFLQRLARAGQPLLLILEDLHWCDDTSLEWLLTFAHQLATQPLFVLLTYRNDETHSTLNHLLARLDRIPYVDEIGLPALTRAGVKAMLRAIFDLPTAPRAEFIDALYTLTNGNPFFIEEVLKSLITSGEIYQEGGAWTRKPLGELHIPRTVQVAVQQRTHQLSSPALQLLTLAAVAGQRFDFAVLQTVTQQTENELLRQVKELLAAQLVIEESDETFAFRHALTQQAIYTGLLGRERKQLHRAVAEALEYCYADALDSHTGELAHHYYQAGLWEKALEWTVRAGDQAMRLYAYSEALNHYTRSRRCAERLGQTEQVAAIDQVIGQVHYARNESPEALEFYTRALHATADPARRAALKAEMGAAYASIADERGFALLREALDELDPVTQAREIASTTLWLGRYYNYHGQFTQALDYLERARELNEPLDDATILRFVYAFLASTLMMSARFEQSMVWARRCITLGEAKRYLPAVALGYYYLSNNAEYLGRWQDACEFADRGRQLTQQSGWPTEETWIALRFARAAYYLDDLAIGVKSARAGLTLAAELGEQRSIVRAHETLALFETALGNEEAAYRAGQAAIDLADALTEVTLRCSSRMALAELSLLREQWHMATELLEQCAAWLAETENRVAQIELGTRLAEAYCLGGRLAEAAQWIAEMLSQTQASGARHYEAVAWRVQGQLLAAQARYAEAADAFEHAIAICEELGSRLELASAHYQRGMLHCAHHDQAAARADWARTCALCEQIGGRALLWRTHAALGQLALAQQHVVEAERGFAAARALVAELGADMRDEAFREHLRRRAAELIPAQPLIAPRGALKAEFGGLTERERAVAALIAQGKSNREIAAALVVSERTVTTHVSNIFAKLGFDSRTQVAHWAREKGLSS